MGVMPQIYREGVRELSDSSVLQRIEIYSQGDLQRIAQDDKLRLELIDRPHKAKVDSYQSERKAHAEKLAQLGPKIRAKRIEVESKRAVVRGLDGLRSQLAELKNSRPTLSEELDRERVAFQERAALIERLEAALKSRQTTLGNVLASLPIPKGLPRLTEELAGLDVAEAAVLKIILEQYHDFVISTRDTAQPLADIETKKPLALLRAHFEQQNARYYALRQDQQSVNDSLKREDTLKDQIAHLERQQAELERMEAEIVDLTNQRQASRDAIHRIGDEIFSLRLREAEAINAAERCHYTGPRARSSLPRLCGKVDCFT